MQMPDRPHQHHHQLHRHNVELTKAQATKVSQMAADAYAHAIRPTHTTNDGDTIYTLASGKLAPRQAPPFP